ncbi:serine O-acetyltransferase [Alphaproteobacteria bacterium]|nr:serine O-acetyltransferase [Alphaproteobacteria bacterium]
MFTKLNRDLSAIMERDPAASSKAAAIFLYPSFQVMFAYRMANPMWRVGLKFLSRFIMQFARWMTNIEIHPGATIGCGFFVDHGAGVVIGETAVIGDNVTLYQGVTLGGVLPAVDASAQRSIKRHPTIGDNVIIGSGAQVLGNITVNGCARVGGNSVVTKDVPEGATVVGVPARQVAAKAGASKADNTFQAYAVANPGVIDPRERTISALVDEVQSLRARLNDLEDRLAASPMHDDQGKSVKSSKRDNESADFTGRNPRKS